MPRGMYDNLTMPRGEDSRNGVSRYFPHGGKRGRPASSGDMTPEQLWKIVDETNADEPEEVKQAIYDHLAARHISKGQGGRGGPYAAEKEARDVQKFKEHEEDRKTKTSKTHEQDIEKRQKRFEAAKSHYTTEVDKLRTQKRELTKGIGTAMDDETKSGLRKLLKDVEEEEAQIKEDFEGVKQEHNLNTLMDKKGVTQEQISQELMERARDADPSELTRLQSKADSLGLKLDLQGQNLYDLKTDEAKQNLGGAWRDTNEPLPDNIKQSAPTAAPSFSERDIGGLREAAGLQPKQPFISMGDVNEAGGNLGSIARNLGQSVQWAHEHPHERGQSFFHGGMPAEAAASRAGSWERINEPEEATEGMTANPFNRDFYSLSQNRLLHEAQILGGDMPNVATRGYLGAGFGRVGQGVEANTGSHTAGQAAELAAGFVPFAGAAGRLASLGRGTEAVRGAEALRPPRLPGDAFPRPRYSVAEGDMPPEINPYDRRGGPLVPYKGNAEPVPVGDRYTSTGGGGGPGRAEPVGATGPNFDWMRPKPLQIERYREPFDFKPPRGGFKQGKFPEGFDEMAGPVQGRPRGYGQAFEGQVPGHPGAPNVSTMYGGQEARPLLGYHPGFAETMPQPHQGPSMPQGYGAPRPSMGGMGEAGAPPGAAMPRTAAERRPMPASPKEVALSRDEREARAIIEQMGSKKSKSKPSKKAQKQQQQQGRPRNDDTRAREAQEREMQKRMRTARKTDPANARKAQGASNEIRRIYLGDEAPAHLRPGYYDE